MSLPATEVYAAFPQLSIVIASRYSSTSCAYRRFDSFLNIIQVVHVLFDSRIDLTAQDNVTMTLNDILKSQAANALDRSKHVIYITIHNIGQ